MHSLHEVESMPHILLKGTLRRFKKTLVALIDIGQKAVIQDGVQDGPLKSKINRLVSDISNHMF